MESVYARKGLWVRRPHFPPMEGIRPDEEPVPKTGTAVTSRAGASPAPSATEDDRLDEETVLKTAAHQGRRFESYIFRHRVAGVDGWHAWFAPRGTEFNSLAIHHNMGRSSSGRIAVSKIADRGSNPRRPARTTWPSSKGSGLQNRFSTVQIRLWSPGQRSSAVERPSEEREAVGSSPTVGTISPFRLKARIRRLQR